MSSDAGPVHWPEQCCAEGKVRPGLSRVGEIWTRGHRALCNTGPCTVITVMYSDRCNVQCRTEQRVNFINMTRNILQTVSSRSSLIVALIIVLINEKLNGIKNKHFKTDF